MVMKVKLFLASSVALGLWTPVFAADLPARPVSPPVVVEPPLYNWSGFYIGANGGWGESRNCWSFVTPTSTIPDGCSSKSGGVFGGQAGYRWQMGQFVFGAEAQGDWASMKATQLSAFNPAFSETTKVDAFGLFTGQIGWAWNTVLLYLKGGAAVTDNRYDVFTTVGGIGQASATATRWGGALGVGFEYAFAPNWSFGIEYDRLFMGDANNSFSVGNPIVAGAFNRVGQNVDLLLLRVNYRFGGPVVARY
jgi:outer membrane immunogenic protein